MYTATLISDVKDIDLRSRVVTVGFSNGTNSHQESFRFSIDETAEAIKRAVKNYLDELNFVPPPLDGDITEVPPDAPPPQKTQAELDREAWVEDWMALQAAVKLSNHGVTVLTSTQLTNLKTKVQTNFKPEYKNLV